MDKKEEEDYREVEVKYLLDTDMKPEGVWALILTSKSFSSLLKKAKERIVLRGRDRFWLSEKGDFVRLRVDDISKRVEITLKQTDKTNVQDRLEINLRVDDTNEAAAEKLLTHLFGSYVQSNKGRSLIMTFTTCSVCVYEVDNIPGLLCEFEMLPGHYHLLETYKRKFSKVFKEANIAAKISKKSVFQLSSEYTKSLQEVS